MCVGRSRGERPRDSTVSVLQASPSEGRSGVTGNNRGVSCGVGEWVSAIAIQTICLELTLWTKPFYNYLARV